MKLIVVLSLMFSSLAWGQSLKLGPYLKLQEALASDDQKAAMTAHAEVCKQNLKKAGYKDCGKKFIDIDELRSSFKSLSEVYIAKTSAKDMNGAIVATCPMAKANWIQKSGGIKNPYYGKSMLDCGEQVKK
jgi:hypothetical protein